MTAAAFFLAAALASAMGVDCPDGQVRVDTGNPYEPFRCQAVGSAAGNHGSSLLQKVNVGRGFKNRPKCPSGFHPVMTPDRLQPYRCVPKSRASAEPDAEGLDEAPVAPAAAPKRGVTIGREVEAKTCPEGTKTVRVEDPFDPVRCVPIGKAKAPGSFKRYTVPGELSFEFPRGWHVTDGWKDEVPTLYVLFDLGDGGQKVALSVTRNAPAQDGFVPLDKHLVREREWQGAQELPRATVAGRKARVSEVAGQSRSAYLEDGQGGYYALGYSAPPLSFETYLPVYQKLLSSFRLEERH